VDYLITIGIIFYLLFIMYGANQVETGALSIDTLRMFLYSLSVFVFLIAPFSLQAVTISLNPANPDLRNMIDPVHAMFVAGFALFCATFGYNMIRSEETREWLAGRLSAYNPNSAVHLSAVLLMLLVAALNTFQFVLTGGLDGVAESVETTGVSIYANLFETALWLVAAFLGTGFAIRRTLPATFERLGLRIPISRDAIIGTGAGIALFFSSMIFTAVWQSLTDPETFAQQIRAAEGFSRQLQSLPVILLVAGGAAIGEEIFMRGALQPVFGIGLTSAFFALLHNQYLLTPTFVFIFFVGVVFGLVRRNVSTTAAVIAHFVYNIAPFLLVILIGESI
jgi:membrane protease YdiL (CAAX protease family)